MQHSQNGSCYAVPSLEEGEIPTEDTQRLSLEEKDPLECPCMASVGHGGGGAEGFDVLTSSSLDMSLRHWGNSSCTTVNSDLSPSSITLDNRDSKSEGENV